MSFKTNLTNLRKYVISNSTSSNFVQGKKIIKNNQIEKKSFSIEHEVAIYTTSGLDTYEVTITDFLGTYHDIDSYCSCPRKWADICAHEVAAILSVIEELNQKVKIKELSPSSRKPAIKKAAKPKLQRRHSDTPILLSGFSNIDTKKIYALCDAKEFRLTAQRFFVDIQQQELGKISFEYRETWWKRKNIEFFFMDGELYSTCDCGQTTNGLCRHQISVLSHIFDQRGADFFKAHYPDAYNSKKKELAAWANIPFSDFDKYFAFDFETKQFIAQGKLTGLINFAQTKDKINFLSENTQQWSIPNSVFLNDDEPIYHMGYILNVSYSFDKTPTIFPFIGQKLNKNNLKTIKSYFDYHSESAQKSRLDQAIISLLPNYDYHTNYCDSFTANNDTKQEFQRFKESATLLAKMPYVFIRHCKYSDKLRKKDIEPIQFSSIPAELFFQLSEKDNLLILAAKLKVGDYTISLTPSTLSQKLVSAYFVKKDDTVYLHKDFTQVLAIHEHVAKNPIFKAKIEDADLFFEQIAQPISDKFPIKFRKLKSIQTETIIMKSQHKQLYISDLGNFVIFEPVMIYDNDVTVKIFKKGDPFKKEKETVLSMIRDSMAELEYIDFLSKLHSEFAEQRQHDFFYLTYDQLLENNWFFDFFENIKDEDIEIFGINNLKRLKYSPHRASISTHIKSGLDWFDVEINLSFGSETISIADLRKAVIQRSKFIMLKDGKLGLLPEEWLKKLESYFRLGAIEGNNIKVSKHKFTLIDELFNDIDDKEILKELAAKRKKIKSFKNIRKIPLSKNITATLRPYQKEGLNWLQFLDDFKWGGILADDMGLGKTVQVLSLLQNLIDTKRQPNLIVVPTSLLFNWQNEFQKFAPKIKYHIHYGPDRSKDKKVFKKYDVILTTYGIMMRDIEMLKTQKFVYVILDESQAIKNVHSQRYKAACLLQAENRVAMTGTPIENNTFDLFAQMNFLNPGFFGTQAGFKRDYSKPIDSNQDSERAKELQRMISPFVLRRTKEQVAKELPPKIEDYIYVNLEEQQQKVYDAYRNKYRDMLLGRIEEDGLNKSKMYVLEGLTKLRLICDSPALIKDEDYFGESAKIKALIQHITEKTASHKMLVFSQFTKMLALVKQELDKQGIPYEYLDGQRTQKQRKASVQNFQDNPKIRVFLLSLKAGNTGLNLTAADYVFLLDPWWNPAVESQAIDRTHRIGQDKHVIAYRMIAKDTIEEKILKLQQRKKKLASDLIQTDESFMKSIKTEDIADLFS